MNIICHDGKFFLKYTDGNIVSLFDSLDFISNCSRIPFHGLNQDGTLDARTCETIKETIVKLASDSSKCAFFRAVAYLLAFRELIKKYRAYKILYVGQISPLTKILTQLLWNLHPTAKMYCISEAEEDYEAPNLVKIHGEYRTFPFPRDYFDVVLTEGIHPDIMKDAFPDVVSSIVPNGLFMLLPAAQGGNSWLKGVAESIGEDTEFSLMYIHIPLSKTSLLKRINPDLIAVRKESVVKHISEIEHGIISMDTSDKQRCFANLDELIIKTAQVEEEICAIYEELVSLDIKYIVSLLKEALIKCRIEKNPDNLNDKIYGIRYFYKRLKTELELDFYR